MNKQTQGAGQALAGTQPYGMVEGARHIGSIMADYHGAGVELAPPSGVEHKLDNITCTAMGKKEIKCMAPRAKGSLFCIGHLRQVEKKLAAQEKEEEVKPEE
jgi:hypothetical protein